MAGVSGYKPDGENGIENHAAERGCRHEWPDGIAQTWCAISQQECISQAMPMNRYDRKPINVIGVAMAGYRTDDIDQTSSNRLTSSAIWHQPVCMVSTRLDVPLKQ